MRNHTVALPWQVEDGHRIVSGPVVVAECYAGPNTIALLAAAPELYALLDRINGAFYSRTSKAEWLKLMEETKPLLQRARGKSK